MHPYKHSLNLLSLLIQNIPFIFPLDRKKKIEEKYQTLMDDKKVSMEEIEKLIIAAGKAVWPYEKAYETIYDRYVYRKREKYIAHQLSNELKEKFFRFKEEGGSLEDFRKGGSIEIHFSPEEKHQLCLALIKAREKARQDTDELVQKEKEEYDQLVQYFQGLREKIDQEIFRLKVLAESEKEFPKLAMEIRERIKDFEKSFSILQPDIKVQDVCESIDYFKGRRLEALQTYQAKKKIFD